MLDRADGPGGQAQLHRFAERIGHQRRLLQVGQETPPGLVVRVADIVSGQHTRPRHAAAPRHRPHSIRMKAAF